MMRADIAKGLRSAASVAASLLLCLQAAWAGPRQGARASHPAGRFGAHAQVRSRVQPALSNQFRPAPAIPQLQPQSQVRPVFPETANRPANGTVNSGAGMARPFYSGPGSAPASQPHLGQWLTEHSAVSEREKEQLLRSDPSFNHLQPREQKRVLQQLNQVDQLSEQRRQRRLARAENLERMSPQERIEVNAAARRLAAMPDDRRALMRSAFRDLRGVPPDQRQTVLNSARYQGVFSPDERGILSNLLRAEPYEPPK